MSTIAEKTMIAQVIDKHGFSGSKRQILHKKDDHPVVERTISWLHNLRRLHIRFERLAFIHEAFMKLACCIICWRKLKNSFC